MLFSSVTPPPRANASSCDDLKLIFARGSGEPLGGSSATAWRRELDAQLQSSQLSYSFYELGSAPQAGSQYPAVSVSGSTDGFLTMLGALFSAGSAYDFGDSVAAGVHELQAYIAAIGATCSETKFILGGYSQGAMVISRTLPDLNPEQIIYAATFGDPKLYLPEGAGLPSAACLGRAYSSYRAYVPDCQAYFGVLGGYQPYEPVGFAGKLGTWCNQDDIMCSSGWSLTDHSAYVSDNLYYDAAIKIRAAVQSAYPDAWTAPASASSHDLAILLDTSESMVEMLDTYRTEAERLADRVYASGGRVALYEFRDIKFDGSPIERCSFECNRDELFQSLDNLKVDGGGDAPESALAASLIAMNTLKWRPNVTKTIVLLTDADYLSPDRDGTTLTEVVQRSLEIDPVNFYIITDDAETADAYSDLAELTGGRVALLGDRTLVTNIIINRPTVSLMAPAYVGRVGDQFHFAVADPNSNLRYDWDLNGDGEFEIANASAVDYVYGDVFTGYIQVRATNTAGLSSTMSAEVTVTATATTEPAAVISSAYAQVEAGSAKISFSTINTTKLLVALDDAVLGFLDPSSHSHFTLTDLKSDSIITLVPYNATGQRGNSVTLALGGIESPTADDPPVDVTAPGNTTPGTTTPNQPTTNPTAPISIIPKAPNAGTPPRRTSHYSARDH